MINMEILNPSGQYIQMCICIACGLLHIAYCLPQVAYYIDTYIWGTTTMLVWVIMSQTCPQIVKQVQNTYMCMASNICNQCFSTKTTYTSTYTFT